MPHCFMQVWIIGSKRPFPGNHHPTEVIHNKIYLLGGLLKGDGLQGGGIQEVQIGTLTDTDSGQVDIVWTSGAAMHVATGSAAHAYISELVCLSKSFAMLYLILLNWACD